MRIGELAQRTDVSIRLLRYYEEQGLLLSTRTAGGHREYGEDAPSEVLRIRRLLAANIPTKVIRDLMPCFVGDGTDLDECVADLLRDQMSELDRRIADLTRARESLGELLVGAGAGASAGVAVSV